MREENPRATSPAEEDDHPGKGKRRAHDVHKEHQEEVLAIAGKFYTQQTANINIYEHLPDLSEDFHIEEEIVTSSVAKIFRIISRARGEAFVIKISTTENNLSREVYFLSILHMRPPVITRVPEVIRYGFHEMENNKTKKRCPAYIMTLPTYNLDVSLREGFEGEPSVLQCFIDVLAGQLFSVLSDMNVKHNILHNDIRAANLLMNDKREIILADFGNARQLEKESDPNNYCIDPELDYRTIYDDDVDPKDYSKHTSNQKHCVVFDICAGIVTLMYIEYGEYPYGDSEICYTGYKKQTFFIMLSNGLFLLTENRIPREEYQLSLNALLETFPSNHFLPKFRDDKMIFDTKPYETLYGKIINIFGGTRSKEDRNTATEEAYQYLKDDYETNSGHKKKEVRTRRASDLDQYILKQLTT